MFKEKKCLKCAQVFTPNSSRSKLCDKCKTKVCSYCGKKFSIVDAGRLLRGLSNFCSSECYLKARWGNDHHEVVLCANCGNKIVAPKSERRRFCSHRCYSLWRGKHIRGEIHPQWKGGVTPETNKRVGSKRWAKIRRKIWERDGWKCQLCGAQYVRLIAHHIMPYRISKSDAASNLITTCEKCHRNAEIAYGEMARKRLSRVEWPLEAYS